MLKYMTLIRGDSEITYPIFELSTIPDTCLRLTEFETSDNITVLAHAFTVSNLPAGIQSICADELPESPDSYGSITQTKFLYQLDTASQKFYCPESKFLTIPIGEKPVDWDTNFFDYYEYQTGQVGNWGNVPLAVNPATDPRQIPVWSSATQYYKNNTDDLHQRFNHLFFTKANYSFGVWSMCGQGEGDAAYKHYSLSASNPRSILFNDQDSYLWRDKNGTQMTHNGLSSDILFGQWRANMAFLYPADYPDSPTFDEIPLTQPRRDMYIFVYCEYNNTMYYGIAGIVSDNSGNWVVGRTMLFSSEFWGDSISDNPPEPEPQGGEWGNDTERGGGDGTFSAPSDNHGDRDGISLLSAISTANTTFKTVLGGNYNLYYVPPADLTKILAVLYSSDYFQRFENSMYNPLSAVLNCALIPEIFCRYSANVSDMTAGGYNISQHIFPNAVQFASPEPLIMQHIGDIDVTKYFGAFPDFAPYTQCKLHLPYIGEIAIDMNKIAHGTLSVDYVCDVMSGNVTAWIWCNDKDGNHTYCYNATGNCAYSIPLFANSSDGTAIGKIIGGIASIAAGNVFSGVASAASGAATAISRHTQITGTFSGNVGLTTNPRCFAEFSRPQWVNPAQYQNQSGIPSEISGKLSDFRGGFVQVETIDLQNVPATEAELAEIESLLESGIFYVSN